MAGADERFCNEILKLIGQKKDLLSVIKELTEKQLTCFNVENIDLLVELIEARQKIMDNIDVLDKKIFHLENDWKNLFEGTASEEWEKILSRNYPNLFEQRIKIKKLLQEIIEIDSKSKGNIDSELQALMKKMVSFQTVKLTTASYKQVPRQRGGFFVDKKK